MRHPARIRNGCIVITLGCLAGFAGVILYSRGGPVHHWVPPVAALLLIAGVTFLALAIGYARTTRAYNRLIAGEGLLTQWMVDPQTWRDFLAYHQQLAPQHPQHRNVLKLNRPTPAEGVEVILGERAVIIDGDYQTIPTIRGAANFQTVQILPGPPLVVNLHILTRYQTKSGVQKRTHALRFPVAPEARDDAIAAVNWYIQQAQTLADQPRSLASRHPKAIRNGSLIVGLVTLAAATLGYYSQNHQPIISPNLAILLMVIGIAAPAAFIMAGACQVILAKQRRTRQTQEQVQRK